MPCVIWLLVSVCTPAPVLWAHQAPSCLFHPLSGMFFHSSSRASVFWSFEDPLSWYFSGRSSVPSLSSLLSHYFMPKHFVFSCVFAFLLTSYLPHLIKRCTWAGLFSDLGSNESSAYFRVSAQSINICSDERMTQVNLLFIRKSVSSKKPKKQKCFSSLRFSTNNT